MKLWLRGLFSVAAVALLVLGRITEAQTPTYTVGATVSGLLSGKTLVLNLKVNNTTTYTSIRTANGSFTFSASLAQGSNYAVTVGIQPSGQQCTVTSGTGTNISSNVTNVTVNCVAAYTVGGSVTGLLPGTSFVLKLNSSLTKVITANGSFSFASALPTGTPYIVSVGVQPGGAQSCSVTGGTGVIGTGNVTNVSVNCVQTYTVGATVEGLNANSCFVAALNSSTKLVCGNGGFYFSSKLQNLTNYLVTISGQPTANTQPTGQKCGVVDGAGQISGANVTTVKIYCLTISGSNTPTATVSISGSTPTNAAISAGTFGFSVREGDSVSLTATKEGYTCTVNGFNNPTVISTNITNLDVNCTANPVLYTVSGTNPSGASLSIDGATPTNTTPTTGGTFSFSVQQGDSISLNAAKAGYNCAIKNSDTTDFSNPTVVNADITGLLVSCTASPVPYTVSGTNSTGATVSISGATPPNSPTNGASFSFTVYSGDLVSLSAAKTGNSCSIVGFTSPTTITESISGLSISCTPAATYTVGGAVMGITSAQSVTLLNAVNGDSLVVTGPSGSTTFKTFTMGAAILSGSNYSISVTNQPIGMVCFVFNPYSGTVEGANVTNVLVTCSALTYTVGGDVSGLGSGKTLTLFLNGGPTNSKTTTTGLSENATGTAVQITSNTTFSFTTGLAPLATYEVTVGSQPDGQTCSIINASGTIVAPVNTPSAPSDPSSNVSNVNVTCVNGTALTASILLGAPTANSIVIKLFSTDQSGSVSVSYGTTSGTYPNITSPMALIPGGTSTEFNLGGLTADTQYFYKINFTPTAGGGAVQTPEYRFHTARDPGSTFSFVVQADPHWDKNTDPYLLRQTFQNMVTDQPDFMLDLGDTFFTEKHNQAFDLTEGVTITGGTSVSTGSPAVSTQAQMIARYRFNRAYFGLVTHSVPLFLVNGNHESEWGTRNASSPGLLWAPKSRLDYYANPKPALQPFYSGYTTGSGESLVRYDSATWYSWRWGDAQFFVLDPYWMSTGSSGWSLTLGKPQYDWLKNTLVQSTADGVKFKFVFLHNLVGGGTSMRGGIEVAHLYEWGGQNTNGSDGFASNRPANQGWTKPIHQLLKENNVTAVFHGHDHVYVNQLHADGIRYQELAQPGGKNTNASNATTNATTGGYLSGTIKPSSGHVRVTVGPNGVTSEYVRSWVQSTSYGYALTGNKEGSGKTNKFVEDSWSCSYVPETGKCQ